MKNISCIFIATDLVLSIHFHFHVHFPSYFHLKPNLLTFCSKQFSFSSFRIKSLGRMRTSSLSCRLLVILSSIILCTLIWLSIIWRSILRCSILQILLNLDQTVYDFETCKWSINGKLLTKDLKMFIELI